ncbi:MAG: shikimate kinase [Synergistaceae bacterium]|nr:shikimate kinase [Synergistaceae bacterium]
MCNLNLNIILIGMPGCGKSVIGLELAELSGLNIIDTDTEIIKNSGLNIIDIFSKFGEKYFRQLEHEVIKSLSDKSGCIIVTGGGAVKDFNNYKYLKRNGRIYHIERDINQLERDGRPLSLNADLNELYNERIDLYKKFRDYVIYNDSTPREAAQKIWEDYLKFNK